MQNTSLTLASKLTALATQKQAIFEERLKLYKSDISFESYLADVLFYINNSANKDELQKCTPEAICEVALKASQKGLAFGNNHAHIVVRGGKPCFDIGYEGYVAMLSRFIPVKYRVARVVYEGDKFDYSEGTISVKDGKIAMEGATFSLSPCGEKRPEKIEKAFAYVILEDGNSAICVMTKEQLDKRRKIWDKDKNGFALNNNQFWKNETDKMYAKTPLRELCRIIAQTYNIEHLLSAISDTDEINNQENVIEKRDVKIVQTSFVENIKLNTINTENASHKVPVVNEDGEISIYEELHSKISNCISIEFLEDIKQDVSDNKDKMNKEEIEFLRNIYTSKRNELNILK